MGLHRPAMVRPVTPSLVLLLLLVLLRLRLRLRLLLVLLLDVGLSGGIFVPCRALLLSCAEVANITEPLISKLLTLSRSSDVMHDTSSLAQF